MKGLFKLLFRLTALIGLTWSFYDQQKITYARRKLQTTNTPSITQNPNDPTLAFQTFQVPTSIYELSSPVDYATQSPGQNQTANGLFAMSPLNHDANYVQISNDLKSYEDAYSACINSLSDNDFSDETVDNCVGIGCNYVYDDIDYEKSKILARTDSAIRDLMIQNCYTVGTWKVWNASVGSLGF